MRNNIPEDFQIKGKYRNINSLKMEYRVPLWIEHCNLCIEGHVKFKLSVPLTFRKNLSFFKFCSPI